MNLFSKIVLTWFIFIPVAIMNGFIREKGYKPYVGDLTAHQISTVIASVAFVLLANYMVGQSIVSLRTWQLLGIGFIWVCMTVAFEFGFGHYIAGASWEKLLMDYNILKGHVWGLFLLVVFFTPLLVKQIRN